MHPTGAQGHPTGAQRRPKGAQEHTKVVQGDPKVPERVPQRPVLSHLSSCTVKMVQNGAKMSSKCTQNEPQMSRRGVPSRRSQTLPRRSPDVPRRSQMLPRRFPDAPRRSQTLSAGGPEGRRSVDLASQMLRRRSQALRDAARVSQTLSRRSQTQRCACTGAPRCLQTVPNVPRRSQTLPHVWQCLHDASPRTRFPFPC